MTHDELQAIQALAAAATPGPWEEWLIGRRYPSGIIVEMRHERNVAQVFNREDDSYPNANANIAFIAAARTAVPALVAEVERLQAELAEIEERLACSVMCPDCNGTGAFAPGTEIGCERCEGRGWIIEDTADLSPERQARLQRYVDGDR